MHITVRMTRDKNILQYGNQAVLELEEYLRGVVPSEMKDSSPMEALKAQAIAARTYAFNRIRAGKTISDTSQDQAFRYERMDAPNSSKAIAATAGMILTYQGIPIQAYYSASNGGSTKRSGDVWRTNYPYYVVKDDPWDTEARKAAPSVKASHGIGMSQAGAVYAAGQGFSFSEILAFYYPETELSDQYGNGKEAGLTIAIRASDLVREFQRMIGWKYEWGAAREGCVDCSGAFAYAYKQLGGFMYHGSNTMWRKYTVTKGKIGSIRLMPGMAVFKWRSQGGPDSAGDYYHVGLYIGNGKVIEAQSKSTGCVESIIDKWHSAAQLKDTIYDIKEGATNTMPAMGTASVITREGSLNLRTSPPSGKILLRIPQNAEVDILAWDYIPGWAQISYNGIQGFVSQNYLRLHTPDSSEEAQIVLRLPFADKAQANTALNNLRHAIDHAVIQETKN